MDSKNLGKKLIDDNEQLKNVTGGRIVDKDLIDRFAEDENGNNGDVLNPGNGGFDFIYGN
ncbi:MAG: hypothetical protein J5959_05120 [Butyrivibrio sp.]|nr:hypothetical protein [Butyrivibrio sp.]